MVDTVKADFVAITAEIVSAFVSNNSVPANSLADLIITVHQSVQSLATKQVEPEAAAALTPAVSVKKSITDDYLICLEDGKKFKSLRRHLLSAYGMSPEQYRAKWNLPGDYPMVSPTYSAQRSVLAKSLGLGSMRRDALKRAHGALPEVEPAPEEPQAIIEPLVVETPKRRGRPPKQAASGATSNSVDK